MKDQGYVYCVAISPDGRLLVTGGEGKYPDPAQLNVWQVAKLLEK